MEYPPQQPYPQPYQQPGYYPPYPPQQPPDPPATAKQKGLIDYRQAATMFIANTAALVTAGVVLAILFQIYVLFLLSRGADAMDKAEKERQKQTQKPSP